MERVDVLMTLLLKLIYSQLRGSLACVCVMSVSVFTSWSELLLICCGALVITKLRAALVNQLLQQVWC